MKEEPQNLRWKELTLLKVSFLSESSSGVPPEVSTHPAPLGFFNFGVSNDEVVRECLGRSDMRAQVTCYARYVTHIHDVIHVITCVAG